MIKPEQFEWNTKNTGDPGWYATVHIWDAQEGLFPGAHYWDGTQWDCPAVIIAHAGPFPEMADASQWAQEHDPEQ